MPEDIQQRLDDWMTPLIARLKPSERKRLARTIGLELAKRNRDRIKRQVNPDGSPFEARAKAREPINKPISFVYRKSATSTRVASLVSFNDDGDRMTGYDREVGGLRTFLKSRVAYYIPPRHRGGGRRPPSKRRNKPMFRKLGSARYLRLLDAGPDGAVVGFAGAMGRIARIHQHGESAKVEKDGPMANYPSRRLLGISVDDEEWLRDTLIAHIQGRR
ncbi:MAG: phage virion morphogenesis protein [Thioalkalivibrio sp.]